MEDDSFNDDPEVFPADEEPDLSDLEGRSGDEGASGGGGGSGNVLHLSPKEVLARLERGWMNEKLGPELLLPLEQEKDAMLRQIKVMEKNIASLDRKDVRTDIHKLELERIKFVVASYMRTRLFKLQEHGVHYFDIFVRRPFLSKPNYLIPEELTFLRGLLARTEEYFRATLLSKMPTPLQKWEEKKFKKYPHLDAHVFFRVSQASVIDVEDVEEEMHQVSLGEGEQHIMRYNPVTKLLMNDSIHLV